jgi:hypothetical protein
MFGCFNRPFFDDRDWKHHQQRYGKIEENKLERMISIIRIKEANSREHKRGYRMNDKNIADSSQYSTIEIHSSASPIHFDSNPISWRIDASKK